MYVTLKIAIDQSLARQRGGAGHLDSREPPRVMQFNKKI